MNAEDCPRHRDQIDEPGGIFYPWTCECPYDEHSCDNCYGYDPGSCLFNRRRVPSPVMVPIPDCTNCGPVKIESHPTKCVVRCANCKEWLAW